MFSQDYKKNIDRNTPISIKGLVNMQILHFSVELNLGLYIQFNQLQNCFLRFDETIIRSGITLKSYVIYY